jgi:hypothetical protein
MEGHVSHSLEAIASLPMVGEGDLVFTTDGKRPLGAFSKYKRKLDRAILKTMRERDPEAKPLPRWTSRQIGKYRKESSPAFWPSSSLWPLSAGEPPLKATYSGCHSHLWTRSPVSRRLLCE